MEKSERIAIAKEILELIDGGEPYYGEESWEGDIGRFIDQERFDLEKQKLFLERPQLIALSADIPNPGDYYATDIAGKPVIITRNKDGKAQAFLNACRHRGVKLAEDCGNGKGFTCPYHGWTFDNDGKLISVPSRSAFEVAQLADRDLIKLPTHEEIGVIVVHPQPGATLDFDAFLGSMKGVLEDMKLDDYEVIATRREVAQINWKHAVDGGMEAYHVPFLHPETFRTDGGGFLPHKQFGDHHAFITSGPGIRELKKLPEAEWPHSCHWGSVNAIFPNTVIGGSEMQPVLFFQRTEPMEKPGVCNYNYRLYARKSDTPEQRAARPDAIKLFMTVAFEEDLPTQVSSQIQMEAGAVKSVLFGRREACLTGMHKGYDAAIGHDAEAALRSNSKAMGL
jgi:phenylpropionate dioxygenase-like ring-hydroxylating dioxygenase large terminal subunit